MNNKPLILVVEDDAAVRSLMAVTLDTQGYRYHLARNGAEALIEASTQQPAVMLLDLGLPDMEGVTSSARCGVGQACPSSSSPPAARMQTRWRRWTPARTIT